jgi:predicted enzyme related to lactoylglutathione lyase
VANDLCYFEIRSRDPDRSRAMLGALFGWEFQASGPDYWMFRAGEGPGGGLQRAQEVPAAPATPLYVHVVSVERTLAQALALGGEVVKPRTAIGDGYGYYALLRDPGGAVIGLWEPEPR